MYLVVLNKKAKQYQPAITEQTLIRLQQTYAPGSVFQHILTERADDLRDTLRHHLEIGTVLGIIIVGGDGTIREVVPVLLDYPDTPITLLPFGTGNLLAKALNLPLDWASGFRLITSQQFQCVPVVKVNDQYSLVAFGIGLDAEVMAQTPDDHKQLLGIAAYFLEGLKQSFLLPELPLTLTCNDALPRRVLANSCVCFVQPTIVQSLLLPLPELLPQPTSPEVSPFRQRGIHVLAARIHQPLDVPLALMAFQDALRQPKSNHALPENTYFIQHHVTQLTITTPKPVPYQIDGDVVGKTPITATLLETALKITI